MSTRHKLFLMPYGHILIDTDEDATPNNYTQGPWDVNMTRAGWIKENRARVDFNEDGSITVVELPLEGEVL